MWSYILIFSLFIGRWLEVGRDSQETEQWGPQTRAIPFLLVYPSSRPTAALTDSSLTDWGHPVSGTSATRPEGFFCLEEARGSDSSQEPFTTDEEGQSAWGNYGRLLFLSGTVLSISCSLSEEQDWVPITEWSLLVIFSISFITLSDSHSHSLPVSAGTASRFHSLHPKPCLQVCFGGNLN